VLARRNCRPARHSAGQIAVISTKAETPAPG
jgi:hypothetical protein